MKVVDELDEDDPSRLEALIVTGDGRSEYRRLKPLSDHYDEDRVLFLPSRTERHLSVVGSTSSHPETERRGWDALDALELYKSQYNYTRFLFLIDQEHCDGSCAEDLREKLDEVATAGVEIDDVNDCAYVCEFEIGSREITLYVAAVGHRHGFFEDCLAELLELQWGNEIDEEDKDEFKSKVNDALSGGSGRTLLANADRRNLEQAFPNLSSILEQFENWPGARARGTRVRDERPTTLG